MIKFIEIAQLSSEYKSLIFNVSNKHKTNAEQLFTECLKNNGTYLI